MYLVSFVLLASLNVLDLRLSLFLFKKHTALDTTQVKKLKSTTSFFLFPETVATGELLLVPGI